MTTLEGSSRLQAIRDKVAQHERAGWLGGMLPGFEASEVRHLLELIDGLGQTLNDTQRNLRWANQEIADLHAWMPAAGQAA